MTSASPTSSSSSKRATVNGDSSSSSKQSIDQIKALETLSIASSDGSIKASFIRAGAHITNLYVKDKKGDFRDVVLGHDDRSLYLSDPAHTYFGAIVGRYANRIKNGTFTSPSSGKTYHVGRNTNNGKDTLHGGFIGWDHLIWSLSSQSSSSLTFSLTDLDGHEGFPGTVKSSVTYTLENDSKWKITITATPDQETPIMLSQHTYWNLDAYQDSKGLETHYLQVKGDKYVKTDGLLIPTGELPSVSGTALDLREAKQVSQAVASTKGTDLCGTGCTGIDNCIIYDKSLSDSDTKMSLWSTSSGIRLDVTTDQIAAQVYTGNGLQSMRNITRKASLGGGIYEDYTCVVLEQQSIIDAINNPEWGVDQFVKKGEEYKWEAEYTFSIVKD